MRLLRTTLLFLIGVSSVLLASCSLESRNLGGPAAVGGTPPKHGFLGLEFANPESLEIAAITSGSPAEAALVAIGDIVVAIDGQPVTNRNELQQLMAKTKPEATIELQLSRGEETRTVQVRLMSFQEGFDLYVAEQKRKNAGTQ